LQGFGSSLRNMKLVGVFFETEKNENIEGKELHMI
jgi:hypothetical protein